MTERYDAAGVLVALVYDDAGQLIGADQTLPLDTALLDAVRLGEPTTESVASVLFILYERLGMHLYRTSFPDPPPAAGPLAADRLHRAAGRNLEVAAARDGPVFDTRAAAVTATHDGGAADHFRDPARFLESALARPADLVPTLLRGHAHGDLHGRNVLVGRIGNRVVWPAVFDYAAMRADNLVGWDFVKLETEFKQRAYADLLPGPPAFAVAVVREEVRLHEETERHRSSGRWPAAPAADTPLERLHFLVQCVRREAAKHLGDVCNRSREWLAEYQFLLAVYGLNALRFDNLTDLQRMAGYLSAGCAAARYLRQRPPVECSYHGVLAEAGAWRTTPTPAALAAARDRLRRGRDEFPEALPIGDELVLVLRRLGELDAAIAELHALDRQFRLVGEETLCRWGSVHKERAVRFIGDEAFGPAEPHLLEAERFYGRAFVEHGTFYPRVNELTVRLVRASMAADRAGLREAVRRDAEALLADGRVWEPRKPDDAIWAAAARGEALALMGKWERAGLEYRAAVTAAGDRAFYVDAMRRQFERLLVPAFARLGEPVGDGLMAVFDGPGPG